MKVRGALKRLWDVVAPERPAVGDRGYRRVLRYAALPVTDRRWAAPLCAAALGFGLFAGIAISPGTSGSGAAPVIALAAVEEPVSEEPAAEESFEEEPIEEEAGGEEEFSEEFPAEESFESFPEEFSEEPFEEEPLEEEELPEEETLGPEEEEEAQVVRGTVVHTNPAAGSYTIVEAGGVLSAVHAPKLPPAGTKVEVPVRTLANGTYAEVEPAKRTGAKKAASLTGIVTFVNADPAAPSYALSKRGTSVLVRVHPDPTGAVPPLPALGAYATVKVDVEVPPEPPAAPVPLPPGAPAPAVPPPPSCAADPAVPAPPAPTAALWQRTVDADGAPFASSDLAGVVMAVCASQGQLLLSGDDSREAGKDIVLTVPGSIELSKVKPGDSVAAMIEIGADGVLTLTGLASDERTKGADDAKATQGELVPQVAG